MSEIKAWEQGKEIRAEQDKVIALFTKSVRNIVDKEVLKAVKGELSKEDK
jgi:hypothetical protein